jgi:hypothetical protein
MEISCRLIPHWKDATIGVKAVINTGKFLYIASDAVWFTEFSGSCNHTRELCEGANEFTLAIILE